MHKVNEKQGGSGKSERGSRAALYALERTLRRREREEKVRGDSFLTVTRDGSEWAFYADCSAEVSGESAAAMADAFAEAAKLVRALRVGVGK